MPPTWVAGAADVGTTALMNWVVSTDWGLVTVALVGGDVEQHVLGEGRDRAHHLGGDAAAVGVDAEVEGAAGAVGGAGAGGDGVEVVHGAARVEPDELGADGVHGVDGVRARVGCARVPVPGLEVLVREHDDDGHGPVAEAGAAVRAGGTGHGRDVDGLAVRAEPQEGVGADLPGEAGAGDGLVQGLRVGLLRAAAAGDPVHRGL